MIVKVNDENFKTEVLKSEKVVVVKLYTEHCSNCIKIKPIFAKAAKENNANYMFCEWEVKGKSEILTKYRIMAVPTLLFFKNAKLIHRKVGVQSEKRILSYLKKIENFSLKDVENNELKGLIDWSFLRFWD